MMYIYIYISKISTVMLNPTPSTNGHYLWTPEVSDNVAPGLDSMITYIQPKCETLITLQNAIINEHNIIQTENS